MSMTREEADRTLQWFEKRAVETTMPGAREMYRLAVEALREQEAREKNEPLTLDELREMDGEPVYIVCKNELKIWALVEVCEESIFLTNNLGGRTEYAADVELKNDGIVAYRRTMRKSV